MTDLKTLTAELEQLEAEYPGILERARKEHPEWFKPLDDIQRQNELIQLSRQDTHEGKLAFYELIHGFPKDDHLVLEQKACEKASENGEIALVFAFRGSWKTMTNTVTDTVHDIGLHPEKSNLIIAASELRANEITRKIIEIVVAHPRFRLAFPNIVRGEKWGETGYDVVDKSISADEWAKRTAGKIDPTVIGLGYSSTAINGKHPTGRLVIDDIHDQDNSASDKQRKEVVEKLLTVILKTPIRDRGRLTTKVIFIGTPWSEDDGYHKVKNSGECVFIAVPAAVRVKEGEGVYCDGMNKKGIVYDDIVGWWQFQSHRYGLEDFKSDRAILGPVIFWQMIMLDLLAARTGGVRYYTYPHNDIDINWPTHGGVDPGYTLKEDVEQASQNSSFAMAFLQKNPKGGAVVTGGIVERCSPEKAANHILAAQNMFPQWKLTAVENVGMGQLFKKTMNLINPNLVIIPSDLGGIRQKGEVAARSKSKKARIEYELAVWLENATITISDRDDRFLNLLRDGLETLKDLDEKSNDERLDVLDAVYHAVKSMPEVLQIKTYDELPSLFKTPDFNPLAGRLALRRKYG